MARSLPDRFLAAWKALPRGTPAAEACRQVETSRHQVTYWKRSVAGFRAAYEALAEHHHVRMTQEELEAALDAYLEELERQIEEDGYTRRGAAARTAGVSLSTIYQKLRPDDPRFDPGFAERHDGIIALVNSRVEDRLDRLAMLKTSEIPDDDPKIGRFCLDHQRYQPRYQNRFQDQRRLEVEQKGTLDVHVHHHQIARAAASIADRFLTERPDMEVLEAEYEEVTA